MSRAGLLKFAIFCHRWLGVFWCVLFAVWFMSGVSMMYWGYPSVEQGDRLARAAALNPSQIQVSPQDAYASLQPTEPPDQVQLGTFNGRPVYRFRTGRQQSLVYADNGQRQADISRELGVQIAAAWTGQPASAARFESNMTEVDQWTVGGPSRALWPLLKYSWPNGDQVYVSTVSGDVVQSTTRGSRIAAYVGAIPHWLYFTPLRKNGAVWRQIVIWASGIGILVSLLGIAIGIWMYSPRKRYHSAQGPSSFPYTGLKRWHAVFGLIFGLVTCSWVFSGLLSMSPFESLTEGPEMAFRLASALRGGRFQFAAFAAKDPRQALAQVAADLQVKELEFTFFAGEPLYLATETAERSRVIPVRYESAAFFDPDVVASVVASASRPTEIVEARLVDKYEAYYVDRHHELPLPALFVRLNDADRSMFYIDLRTARIVQAYSARSRWNRWLYHGLHSFDFPWLYRYRPLWDILVLALLIGGITLSLTAVTMGWQLVRNKLKQTRRVPSSALP
jgi:hypothetical protein